MPKAAVVADTRTGRNTGIAKLNRVAQSRSRRSGKGVNRNHTIRINLVDYPFDDFGRFYTRIAEHTR